MNTSRELEANSDQLEDTSSSSNPEASPSRQQHTTNPSLCSLSTSSDPLDNPDLPAARAQLERNYSNTSSISARSTQSLDSSGSHVTNSDADSATTVNTREARNDSNGGGSSDDSTKTTTLRGSLQDKRPTLSDYLQMQPVSEVDWAEWIRSGGLSSSSRGIRALEGVDQRDAAYWSRHGFLPAPPRYPNAKIFNQKHHEVLLRHGFDDLDSIRPILARSTRLARKQFNVEFAAFSITSFHNADELVRFGGLTDDDIATMNRSGNVCAHALQDLEVPRVFHLPEMDLDFRFAKNPNICINADRKFKFYISVPLCLPTGRRDDRPVPIGRLCLLSETPREWTDEESLTLQDICTMTSDSLEKLHQTRMSDKMGVIQRSLTFLTRSIDENSLIDHSQCRGMCNSEPSMSTKSSSSSLITPDGIAFCPKRVEVACSSIESVLGAQSVIALDLSDFKTSSTTQMNPDASPSNSIFSVNPWISNASPQSDHRRPSIAQNSLQNERRGSTHVSGFKTHSRVHSLASSFPFFNSETEMCPVPLSGPSLISGSTKDVSILGLASEYGNETQRLEIARWLARWKLEQRKTLPVIYETSSHDGSGVEKEAELFTPGEEDRVPISDSEKSLTDPLASLLPNKEETELYIALPIFDLNDQPMFLILASFNQKVSVEQESLLFLENAAMVIRSSILRQQVGAAEHAAKYFVSQVQTPLHAILGTSSLLQQSIPVGDGSDAPCVDLSNPQVLTSLLSGIQLAGNNLDSILEDVLDFSQTSALRDSQKILDEKAEAVDVVKLCENLASQQLEHLLLTSSVGEGNTAQELTSSIVGTRSINLPPLLITVDPMLDNSTCLLKSVIKVKKILYQIISNAVRFASGSAVEIAVSLVPTESSSLLEFKVTDSGMGMTRSFVETELLRPFSKGSFYRQGLGLGMSLAGNLSQLIGADLKVDSEIGVGTQVSFVVESQIIKSKPEAPRVMAVKTAAFIGFSSQSAQKARAFISAELLTYDFQICEAELAEVLICDQDAVALDGVAALAMRSACTQRVIIISSSLEASRSGSILDGVSVLNLRLPYGPTMLRTIREYLGSDLRPSSELVDPGPVHLVSDSSNPIVALTKDRESAFTAAALSSVAISIKPSVDEFRVLIVEDNPLNLRLLTTLTQRLKIKTATAMDGMEAVVKYLEFKPSLVLLDISLPLQDGFEACIQMRQHQGEEDLSRRCRIIAVTALSSASDRAKGAQSGIDEYRCKPVSMREMRNDLETWRKDWNEKMMVGSSE